VDAILEGKSQRIEIQGMNEAVATETAEEEAKEKEALHPPERKPRSRSKAKGE
jgi:hypothetical protein